jgi:hypothetical protein
MKFTKKTMAYILIALAAIGGIIYLVLNKGQLSAPAASAPGAAPDPRGSWAGADDEAFKQMIAIGKSADAPNLGPGSWIDVNAAERYASQEGLAPQYTIDLQPSKSGSYLANIDSDYYGYEFNKLTPAQHDQLWQIWIKLRAKYAQVIY